MFRRHNGICSTEQGISTGCKNFKLIAQSSFKEKLCAVRSAYPVSLLSFYSINKIKIIKTVKQTIRILCYFKHPLAFIFMNNFTSATLTNAVYYLFICKNAFAGSTPVYRHFFFICKTVFKKL